MLEVFFKFLFFALFEGQGYLDDIESHTISRHRRGALWVVGRYLVTKKAYFFLLKHRTMTHFLPITYRIVRRETTALVSCFVSLCSLCVCKISKLL